MADESISPDPREGTDPLKAAIPYLAPYLVFGLFNSLAGAMPDHRSLIYVIKTFVVAGLLWYYRKTYVEIKARLTPAVLVAVLVGLAVIVVWVGADRYYPQTGAEIRDFVERDARVFTHADKAQGGFNPYDKQQDLPPLATIVFRILGAVLVVPIFEELAIRGWLMRYLINERFWRVPVGAFTHPSFWIGVGAMVLTHHEWLAAAACSAAFNGLLYWKKDLFLCIIAHGVANLALAIYVLSTGAWGFW